MTEMLTRVHNKHYDLTGFQHPGGDVAISMSYGRDATELFETYHQFCDKAKVQSMLAKYEVKNLPKEKEIPSNNLFDWEKTWNSEFYKEIMESTAPYFKRNGTKITPFRIFELLVIFGLTALQYWYFIKGYDFSLVTFPTLLWFLCVNTAHDASHFAISRIPLINDILFYCMVFNATTYYWIHQHIIGHHNFVNVYGMDPDIMSIKMYRHNKEDVLRPIHKYQAWYPLIFPFRFPISFIVTTVRALKSDRFLNLKAIPFVNTKRVNKNQMAVQSLFVILFMHVLPFFYHGLTLKGLLYCALPYSVFSIHSMISTSVNHQHVECDEQFSDNFYVHQVITGHNVDSFKNYLVYLYTGGLNYQIEHHIFPSVNHCHLVHISPIVIEICRKHNVKYNKSGSIREALNELIKHMKKMSTLTVTK